MDQRTPEAGPPGIDARGRRARSIPRLFRTEILVSETTAALLEGRYGLGTRRVMQLKGKGATPSVPLIGPAS